jgi:4-amino-4-deoxy-L-arabinose transferase-like glycosyltransferase
VTFRRDFYALPARWVPAVLLGIVVVVHLPGLANRVFNNDEAYVATVADVIAHGGRLYVDAVDRKPPGLFYLYHWLFDFTGSRQLWIPRIAGMLAHGTTATLVWVFARRRLGVRAGLVAGVLAALASVTVTPGDAQSAEFEVFMMPLVLAAMVLADRKRPLGSGLAIGAATMMKQTAATTLLPLAWIAWRNRATRWSHLTQLAVGTAVPVMACALMFGPRRLWFWVFGAANGQYLDIGNGGLGPTLHRMLSTNASIIGLNIALFGLAAMAWRCRRDDIDVWLWLLSAVIGVVSGTRFFGHYYWQLLPPLCILAARGATQVAEKWTRIGVATMALTSAGAAIAAVALHLGGPTTDYEALADYVKANTTPDEKIFVWGHEPALFWAADRLPASRVITTGFLTGHTTGRPAGFDSIDKAVPGLWNDVMADLNAHPPTLFFDTQPDDPLDRPDFPMSDYPPIEEFVDGHYQLVGVVERIFVYRLAVSP